MYLLIIICASMKLEFVLKKKYVSIAYNIVREAFAASIINVYFVPSAENLGDGFTKFLQIQKRRLIYLVYFGKLILPVVYQFKESV